MTTDPLLYIFDADGTLRRCTVPNQPTPHAPDEWELFPDVVPRLKRIDWDRAAFGIASNQAGIALGYLTKVMADRLLIDLVLAALDRKYWPPRAAVQFCPHGLHVGCICRKPEPGMLVRLCSKFDVAPAAALFVGDRPEDEDAAARAGTDFAWAWDFFGRPAPDETKTLWRRKTTA